MNDAMAIFVALKSPEVDVIGLTTIYGNVYTTLATRNALHLLEVAGRTDIPVAEGTHKTILNGTKLRVADFVHGEDGLGNQNFPPPEGKPIEKSAPEFLVEQAKLHPGEITVVALGPLTNIALAVQLDPEFSKNVGQIVLLGGSFAVNGNVNPASEANGAGSIKGKQANSVSDSEMRAPRDGQNISHEAFQFSASNNERLRENRPPKEARESSQHRAYKSQSMSWQERSLHRRSYQARERTRQDYERPSRPMREQVSHQYPPGPPGRSYYREVPKRITETRLSDSSAGTPHDDVHPPIPQAAFNEAMGEMRNVMLQCTKTADPTESEARKERMRHAEEQGDMEETSIQMNTATPERIPVSQRLSGIGLIQTSTVGKDKVTSASSNHERVPATHRLGPPPNPLLVLQDDLGSTQNMSSEERLPAPYD
ncbi:hypothetical protein HID58_079163 [Brassica napus]|uniref:Inosine/uridine-preferring nucleoside hydrolase domain-containing protein n=2 Tax=Brassica napus TaxID=3708 RepID=A0ABQ7Y192_BRANA|nr:hypothetical protein HID58_079163 [Brassica napus]